MSIAVTVGAHRVFEDRIDLVVRSPAGVAASLRLSRDEATSLALHLVVASREGGGTVHGIAAVMEHPASPSADPPAPP